MDISFESEWHARARDYAELSRKEYFRRYHYVLHLAVTRCPAIACHRKIYRYFFLRPQQQCWNAELLHSYMVNRMQCISLKLENTRNTTMKIFTLPWCMRGRVVWWAWNCIYGRNNIHSTHVVHRYEMELELELSPHSEHNINMIDTVETKPKTANDIVCIQRRTVADEAYLFSGMSSVACGQPGRVAVAAGADAQTPVCQAVSASKYGQHIIVREMARNWLSTRFSCECLFHK